MGRRKRKKGAMSLPERIFRVFLIVLFVCIAVVMGAMQLNALFFLAMGLVVWQFVCLAKAVDPDAPLDGEPLPSDQQPVIRDAQPQSAQDYIYALYGLPLGRMPLGIYGHKAAKQVELLMQKRMGLRAMLGSDHPFLNSAQEAESYILANCKKILWRLKYCDQGDPALCRQHAEYMEERLKENEKVLHDFESLMIEITHINDDTPSAEPTLDVLADSLRTLRGDDQQQMMM